MSNSFCITGQIQVILILSHKSETALFVTEKKFNYTFNTQEIFISTVFLQDKEMLLQEMKYICENKTVRNKCSKKYRNSSGSLVLRLCCNYIIIAMKQEVFVNSQNIFFFFFLMWTYC